MTDQWTERFKGSICALVTPFTEDGAVDRDAYARLVDWHIESGTHGLVSCGTTGESVTLDEDEHVGVIRLCVEAASGRVPVIGGTGGNNTAHTVTLTRAAREAGADAALLVVPYYNKPTQEGLYRHFKAVHDAVDLPLILYNIPGRSAVDLSVATLARLSELPRIIGIKDATASMSRASQEREACGNGFLRLSGEDATALGFMAHGGHGCISVSANVAPVECAAFQEACLRGDYAAALAFQDRLMPLHRALFIEANPGPVKYALSLRGLCRNVLRLPMVSVAPETEAAVRAAMVAAGLLNT